MPQRKSAYKSTVHFKIALEPEACVSKEKNASCKASLLFSVSECFLNIAISIGQFQHSLQDFKPWYVVFLRIDVVEAVRIFWPYPVLWVVMLQYDLTFEGSQLLCSLCYVLIASLNIHLSLVPKNVKGSLFSIAVLCLSIFSLQNVVPCSARRSAESLLFFFFYVMVWGSGNGGVFLFLFFPLGAWKFLLSQVLKILIIDSNFLSVPSCYF